MIIELCQVFRILRQVFEEVIISSMSKLKGAVSRVRRVLISIVEEVFVETMEGWTDYVEAGS